MDLEPDLDSDSDGDDVDWGMVGRAMRHLPNLTKLDLSGVCRTHRGVLISCRVVLCLFSQEECVSATLRHVD